ncbi:MAG: hypothetical protein LC685_03205 [Actinobacteria bacterium]|nr:hypothetical protein [Actinomycetota bacterium]
MSIGRDISAGVASPGGEEAEAAMSDHSHDDLDQRLTALEALEHRIQALEARLDQVAGGPPPHYSDSGTVHPELDDQAIAP